MNPEHTGTYRSGRSADPRDHSKVNDCTSSFHPKTEGQAAIRLIGKKYPRIRDEIVWNWGQQRLTDRLQFMLNVDTNNRLGFPFDVGNALMIVALEHARQFKHETKSEAQLRAMFKPDRW